MDALKLTNNANNSPLSSFIHLRVTAITLSNSKKLEVCLDLGIRRFLISINILEKLKHFIEDR